MRQEKPGWDSFKQPAALHHAAVRMIRVSIRLSEILSLATNRKFYRDWRIRISLWPTTITIVPLNLRGSLYVRWPPPLPPSHDDISTVTPFPQSSQQQSPMTGATRQQGIQCGTARTDDGWMDRNKSTDTQSASKPFNIHV